MVSSRRRILLAVSLAASFLRVTAAARHPAARREDTMDTYAGVTVADPYRWLERDSAETTTWVRAQETLLDDFLHAKPTREATRARLLERLQYEVYGLPVEAGGQLFYSKSAAGGAGTVLWVKDASGDRAILDVTHQIDPHARLAGYVPSPDGRLVALEIGEELGDAGVGCLSHAIHESL